MTSGRTTRALCVCDGAAVPADLAGQTFDHRLEITTRGKDPELNFVVEDLLGKLSGRMDPLVQDLLSLAAYCFAADRMVRRGGPIDVHRKAGDGSSSSACLSPIRPSGPSPRRCAS